MDLKEVLNYRRAVRYYDSEKPIDEERVMECLRLATLAPSGSNMQLYGFYHITNPKLIAQMADACLGQEAVQTANQLVVFVTRHDLYKKRAKQVMEFERGNIQRNSPKDRQKKRIKDREMYYGKLIPFLYARCFGLLGLFRVIIASVIGLFRPMMREVSESDSRVELHRSCALSEQTFMIAMTNEGYDTCPLAGIDSSRIKRLLHLPRKAEIDMVVSCGIRKGDKGVWGERYRVPFEEIYNKI